jgi:hypothetical protein
MSFKFAGPSGWHCSFKIATIPGLYTDNPFTGEAFLPNAATSKMSMAGTVHQKRVWNSVTVWNGPGTRITGIGFKFWTRKQQ